MHINKIHMNHYRNYNNQIIEFDPNINIIYGENAQGKTNVLEAINLCATSKSHRTNKYKELIQFGEDSSHIALEFIRDSKAMIIDVHLKKNNKKGIAINKTPISKLSELFGHIHVIMFSPEDLSLIKNGPKERRRFIDIELCQLNPLYYYNLKNFSAVLNQRNNLLKQLKYNNDLLDQLEIWDMQLVTYGSKVIELREKFLMQLDTLMHRNHYMISGEREEVHLLYHKSVHKDDFENKLKANHKIDLKFGTTSVGPHKDDILFKMGDIDLRKFGSQGQQRTAALSLKLSEIELIKAISQQQPILLLDDVLSELDQHRQQYLIHYLNDIQTIITCTGVEDFMSEQLKIGKQIEINNGFVVK